MKTINDKFLQMTAGVPKDIQAEIDLSFAISNEIYYLMQERGLTKKQFADALGKKPSEVTKWLSGQHNFTIRTIAMLSTFFGKPIIRTVSGRYVLPEDEESSMVAEDVAEYGEKDTRQELGDLLREALEENRKAMIARNEPELTLDEINAEIAAARAERKARMEGAAVWFMQSSILKSQISINDEWLMIDDTPRVVVIIMCYQCVAISTTERYDLSLSTKG